METYVYCFLQQAVHVAGGNAQSVFAVKVSRASGIQHVFCHSRLLELAVACLFVPYIRFLWVLGLSHV